MKCKICCKNRILDNCSLRILDNCSLIVCGIPLESATCNYTFLVVVWRDISDMDTLRMINGVGVFTVMAVLVGASLMPFIFTSTSPNTLLISWNIYTYRVKMILQNAITVYYMRERL